MPGLAPHVHSIGEANTGPRIRFEHRGVAVIDAARVDLHRAWSETSHRMQSLRDDPECAREAFDTLLDDADPGLGASLACPVGRTAPGSGSGASQGPTSAPHTARPHAARPQATTARRPRVAILREQGVNGHRELAAAFDQDTTKRMITECHRLGKKVIVHAKGAEAMLFGARAGADVIYHASWADEEALDAARENGCVICPSLTIIYNNNTFTQTTDASFNRTDHGASEWAAAHVSARRARELGIPLMAGSDSGFAINPCGEWHARELDLMVKHVGLTTAEVLRAATALNATFFDDAGRMGALEVGRHADILVVDGDPLADVAVLLDKSAIKEVYLEGEPVRLAVRPAQLAGETDNTYRFWQDMYDQRRVAELAAESRWRAI